jgi:hypothetical protein
LSSPPIAGASAPSFPSSPAARSLTGGNDQTLALWSLEGDELGRIDVDAEVRALAQRSDGAIAVATTRGVLTVDLAVG